MKLSNKNVLCVKSWPRFLQWRKEQVERDWGWAKTSVENRQKLLVLNAAILTLDSILPIRWIQSSGPQALGVLGTFQWLTQLLLKPYK